MAVVAVDVVADPRSAAESSNCSRRSLAGGSPLRHVRRETREELVATRTRCARIVQIVRLFLVGGRVERD